MTNKTDTFTVKLTETRVTTKTITLDKCDEVTDILSAENYVYDAMQNLGFGEITERPTVQDEYELTYNGKQEWELELSEGSE